MSDTPRTDAKQINYWDTWRLSEHVVPIEFARELERELKPRNGHTFESLQRMWEDTHIELAQVISERDQLRAEVSELRADKERLDWLEKETPNALCLCTWGGSTIVPDEELKPDGHVWEINDRYKDVSLRAAITAAMREKQC